MDFESPAGRTRASRRLRRREILLTNSCFRSSLLSGSCRKLRSSLFRSACPPCCPLPAGFQNLNDAHAPQPRQAVRGNRWQFASQACGLQTHPQVPCLDALDRRSKTFFQPAQPPGNSPHGLCPAILIAFAQDLAANRTSLDIWFFSSFLAALPAPRPARPLATWAVSSLPLACVRAGRDPLANALRSHIRPDFLDAFQAFSARTARPFLSPARRQVSTRGPQRELLFIVQNDSKELGGPCVFRF